MVSRRNFLRMIVFLSLFFMGCGKEKKLPKIAKRIKLTKEEMQKIQEGVNQFREKRLLVVKRGDQIYGLSQVCSHQACLLKPLYGENRLICPCHGSQFDTTGRVLRGPAQRDLRMYTPYEDADGSYIFVLSEV